MISDSPLRSAYASIAWGAPRSRVPSSCRIDIAIPIGAADLRLWPAASTASPSVAPILRATGPLSSIAALDRDTCRRSFFDKRLPNLFAVFLSLRMRLVQSVRNSFCVQGPLLPIRFLDNAGDFYRKV
jgi:hypothetical protein